MAVQFPARITSNGRVTIPADEREKIGVEVGDYVNVVVYEYEDERDE